MLGTDLDSWAENTIKFQLKLSNEKENEVKAK